MKFHLALALAALHLAPAVAQWTWYYSLDDSCVNAAGEDSGSGNVDCTESSADTQAEAVEITGLDGSGCIVTFYENAGCDLADDNESFDEDEGCANLGFYPAAFDVTQCN